MLDQLFPNPKKWASIHKSLIEFSSSKQCEPREPPRPLILAGWSYSSDDEKKARWQEFIDWAKNNQCSELISLNDDDYA
jgi:hypothetical protein